MFMRIEITFICLYVTPLWNKFKDWVWRKMMWRLFICCVYYLQLEDKLGKIDPGLVEETWENSHNERCETWWSVTLNYMTKKYWYIYFTMNISNSTNITLAISDNIFFFILLCYNKLQHQRMVLYMWI